MIITMEFYQYIIVCAYILYIIDSEVTEFEFYSLMSGVQICHLIQ